MLSQVVYDFEAVYQQGQVPRLEDFVPPDGPERTTILGELIRIDLEYRHKRGLPIHTDAYLTPFPEIARDEALMLELLEAECRHRQGSGEVVTLDELVRDHSALAAGLATPRIDTAMAASSRQVSAALPALPGYDILEVLGEGGMGIVYKARQRALNRIVALKRIKGSGQVSPQELQRFRTEAEAVAQLQHPNIVQIHEVGECAGLPFFTLEYCAGGSLARKLDGKPLPPRDAAVLVETLAQALDAAHRKQIIHRDLKPHNVLLTEDGTPKIGDFGLAKRLDTGSDATRSGLIVGTPSYMAPEQAKGDRAAIGPRADVYALGAILYETLTGRPPFLAATPLATILLVREEDPVPPRRLQPKTPRDLETICLKCLRKDPGGRYESAQAVADDLRRFRNGEVIRARPAGAVERLWRACRRNPRVAILSGFSLALLLLMAIGSTVAALRIAQEQQRTAAEKQTAEQQRDRADKKAKEAQAAQALAEQKSRAAVEHYFLALGITADMLGQVQERLGERSGALKLREELVAKALQSLQQLSRSAEKTPATDLNAVLAHERLGDLFLITGKTDEARRQFERALHTAQELARTQVETPEVQRAVANVHDKLGQLALRGRQVPQARQHFGKAFDVRAALAQADGRDVRIHNDLSVSRNQLGDICSYSGDYQAALAYHGAALAELQAFPQGDRKRDLRDLCFTHGRMGDALLKMFDYAAAADHYVRADQLARELQQLDPANVNFQRDAVICTNRLGNVALRQMDYARAAAAFGKSLKESQALAQAEPGNHELQHDVVVAQGLLGDAQAMAGRLDEACTLYDQAIALCTDLVRRDPGSSSKHDDLWRLCYKSGTIAATAQKYKEVARCCERLLVLIGNQEAQIGGETPASKQLKQKIIDFRANFLVADRGLDDPASWHGQPRDIALLQGLRTLALARRGRYAEAVAAADALNMQMPREPEYLFLLGRCYALAARAEAAAKGTSVPATSKDTPRQAHKALFETLRELLARNPLSAYEIELESDFDPIRVTPEFLRLLREANRPRAAAKQ
jgi:serine/threonine-protein kinase